jgi:hypothetical protein
LRIAPDSPAIKGVYSGDSLSAHINDWYKRRYGKRLETSFGPGSAAIFIKGDPWKITFPLVIGEAQLVFDPDLEKWVGIPRGPVSGKVVANPLLCIEGFTTDFAKSLNVNEMEEIALFFVFALGAEQRLFEIKSKSFIPEARSDLASAINSIFLNPPNFGQSKWASLQFAEKLFKCFLKERTGTAIPKVHKLAELAHLAVRGGLQSIPPQLLDSIQCEAGVRYGECPVTAEEAMEAHHCSLEICSIISPAIMGTTVLDPKPEGNAKIAGTDLKEGHFYVWPRNNFFYYCDKIAGDTVHWILVESHQFGDLIQANFTALVVDSIRSHYVEVRNKSDIARLTKMLSELRKK